MNVIDKVTENKYVVFMLNGEYYGLDIYNVKSIEKAQDFTRIPNAPSYIKGVINLRGDVVPVVDLRNRFSLPTKSIDSNTRIIIVSLTDMLIGLIVDSSSEVIEIDSNSIDAPPSVKENISEDYVKGIGKKNGRLIILLDIEKTLGIKENQEITQE